MYQKINAPDQDFLKPHRVIDFYFHRINKSRHAKNNEKVINNEV